LVKLVSLLIFAKKQLTALKYRSSRSNLSGSILIPASKSHSIRAFSIAGMAHGKSVLKNSLISADTLSCIEGIEELGARVNSNDHYTVKGNDGKISGMASSIDVGNSGTTLRILTGLASLSDKEIKFDGDESIRKRPMTPLLTALKNLGATIESTGGKCPFTIRGPLKGGSTKVDGISSQFLTSLLICSPLIESDTEISVFNLHEKPYVEITLEWLRKQNIRFEQEGLEHFKIMGGQYYTAFNRAIPADFSTATFPLCAAAITGSEILIRGLDFADHQGDKQVFEYLKEMGVSMHEDQDGLHVKGGNLTGIEIDMNNTPDALPAMAVAGCFASGKTKLFNVAQARFKECDRISSIATELMKMGAKITELDDGLIIEQSDLQGTMVHGYDDHRMVMALTIAGLGASGETTVDTAESVKITYPTFYDDMTMINAKIERIQD